MLSSKAGNPLSWDAVIAAIAHFAIRNKKDFARVRFDDGTHRYDGSMQSVARCEDGSVLMVFRELLRKSEQDGLAPALLSESTYRFVPTGEPLAHKNEQISFRFNGVGLGLIYPGDHAQEPSFP